MTANRAALNFLGAGVVVFAVFVDVDVDVGAVLDGASSQNQGVGLVVWENRNVLLDRLPCACEFPDSRMYTLEFSNESPTPQDDDDGDVDVRGTRTPETTKKPSAKKSYRGTEADNRATKKARYRDMIRKLLLHSRFVCKNTNE